MRIEEIRQQFEDEFVLIEVTKTDKADDAEILEGNVLAHSEDREEILALMVKSPAKYVVVEWCGDIDSKVAVVI